MSRGKIIKFKKGDRVQAFSQKDNKKYYGTVQDNYDQYDGSGDHVLVLFDEPVPGLLNGKTEYVQTANVRVDQLENLSISEWKDIWESGTEDE